VRGAQQFLDPQTVLAPLLYLVEVVAVGIEWIVGFFVGPVGGWCRDANFALHIRHLLSSLVLIDDRQLARAQPSARNLTHAPHSRRNRCGRSQTAEAYRIAL
jgi:hypothetical protein